MINEVNPLIFVIVQIANSYLKIISLLNRDQSMETSYIKSKKEKNGRIYYLVCQDGKQNWYDFDSMSDYVQMVIDYQKSRSHGFKQSSNTMKDEQQIIQVQNQDQQDFEQDYCGLDKQLIKQFQVKQKFTEQSEKIVQLRFEKKVGNQLYFYVEKRNGQKNILTNNELKKIDPLALITFYENFIIVQKN